MNANAKVLEEIDTHIWGILPEQIPQYAHRILPILQKVATPDTGCTPYTVLDDIAHSRLALWIIGDFKALACTEFQDRHTGRVLWTTWLAGEDMDEWVGDWLRVQEAFARSTGCTAIEFAGRKGYARKYMPHFNQFKATRTVYRQEL